MRTFDLAPLYRSTVGFDRLFSLLDQGFDGAAPGYPPYNIERTGENEYRVTVAVAGFAESDKLDSGEVARRVSEFAGLAEEVMAQRAADRIGESVEVLVEETVLAADGGGEGRYEGRAAHQAPDVDGSTTLLASRPLRAGDLVSAQVVDSVGADLIARA